GPVGRWLVVKVVVAPPIAFVMTSAFASEPAVVVKLTGALFSALPLMSKTSATMVVDPPFEGTDAGLALIVTRPTGGVPTAILTPPFAPVEAPPEVAVIVAVPLESPARNRTITRPLTSVSTSGGATVPRVVKNVTCVPEE